MSSSSIPVYLFYKTTIVLYMFDFKIESSVQYLKILYLFEGVYVIGPGEQGILFQYHEKEFGDHADLKDIMAAVENIKST